MSVNVSKNRIDLYPLGSDKETIKKGIANNQTCADLILGENNSDIAKGYSAYDILIGNTSSGLKGQIKNRLYMMETQYETKTYVLMDTYVIKAENTNIKQIGINIEAFTHVSLLDLSTTEQVKFLKQGFVGDRIDCLLDAIFRYLTTVDIGIGKVVLDVNRPVNIITPIKDYYGKAMTLNVYDF